LYYWWKRPLNNPQQGLSLPDDWVTVNAKHDQGEPKENIYDVQNNDD
jgi:hypothetical protein